MQIDANEIQGVTYNGLEVSELWVDGSLVWPQSTPPHDYSKDYLTFDIVSGGTIMWKKTAQNVGDRTMSYSKDSGSTWTTISATTAGTSFNVSAGERVLVRTETTSLNYTFNGSTASFNLEGNIMSLRNPDPAIFSGMTDIGQFPNTFQNLFQGTNVISAENLLLPATSLSLYAYRGMFKNCTSLIAAPELPATELPNYCYAEMFRGCTSLTVAPALPATELYYSCYALMFQGCTSLVEAPELPATTLANNCYSAMFAGCNSLVTAPELPATTLVISCYNQMFQGCDSLVEAPELPATTLVISCYSQMFRDCTSLSAITCYATDISANNCTSHWVDGVGTSGTLYAHKDTGWECGENGIPEEWNVEDLDGAVWPSPCAW